MISCLCLFKQSLQSYTKNLAGKEKMEENIQNGNYSIRCEYITQQRNITQLSEVEFWGVKGVRGSYRFTHELEADTLTLTLTLTQTLTAA